MAKFLDLDGLEYYTKQFKPGLVDLIDNSAKNEFYFGTLQDTNGGSHIINGNSITVAGTERWAQTRCYFNVKKSLVYIVSATITSLETPAAALVILDIQADTQLGVLPIYTTGTYKFEFTPNSNHTLALSVVANNTSSSIPSGTITATDIMVCTKADYNISQTYQPYKTPYDGTATQSEIENTFFNN